MLRGCIKKYMFPYCLVGQCGIRVGLVLYIFDTMRISTLSRICHVFKYQHFPSIYSYLLPFGSIHMQVILLLGATMLILICYRISCKQMPWICKDSLTFDWYYNFDTHYYWSLTNITFLTPTNRFFDTIFDVDYWCRAFTCIIQTSV